MHTHTHTHKKANTDGDVWGAERLPLPVLSDPSFRSSQMAATRGSTVAKLAFGLFSIVSSGISNPQTHWPSPATFVPYAGDCWYKRKVYHQSGPVSPVNKILTHTKSTSLM